MPDNPKLVPDIARPLLRRLTDPTPDAQAKLYAPDGTVIADSRVREGPSGAVSTEPLPPAVEHGPVVGAIGWVYDKVLTLLPHETPTPLVVDMTPGAGGLDWQPDVKEELRLNSSGQSREMPPYIRRTKDNQLLVTVAEPVERDRHTVGIVLLTREAREVDASLFVVRMSILALFGLALALTVLLSWYLSLTIARPILRLAGAAAEMREGQGRAGSVPAPLLARRDEVGALATALSDSAQALWARMDAIEQFAADVAHEIKNPLSSIRSAIETLRRIEDPERQQQLLTIIAQDVTRLDRLISDVSDASRLDAELSRMTAEPVDVVPILQTLRELDEATRDSENDPRLVVDAPSSLMVWAVEDRLVQVLRNLIANAQSFSPPRGRIALSAQRGRRHGRDQRRGRRAGHPRGQSGAGVRPVLFRAAEGREVRPAFGARAVDQPADRRGAARADLRREPARDRQPGAGRAVRGEAAEGVMRRRSVPPCGRSAGTRYHAFIAPYSKLKMRFQSFFMLITVQCRVFASSISDSAKVPTLVSGSPPAGP